ncbi:hypothetical protein PSTG_05751 [Puccinia striiformis f. sp. tritici PST-78]|uniref:Uncharacterized protein n=1 Tax=Puccinia striiformis f. sp. tritici PST-78 TaxID=1165861 RepID=A0A0L0VPB2_9BASI|nr:hypothetical protein PSTG_05751 [Puccinia striiformis f. sp. tritici PST-78]
MFPVQITRTLYLGVLTKHVHAGIPEVTDSWLHGALREKPEFLREYLTENETLHSLMKQYQVEVIQKLVWPSEKMHGLLKQLIEEIDLLRGGDDQSAAKLAHYALVLARITPTLPIKETNPFQYSVKALIADPLNKLITNLDPRSQIIFRRLQDIWDKPEGDAAHQPALEEKPTLPDFF